MERHGRQQLLKPSIAKKLLRSSKSGQALVELLPATILFFTVMVGAFSYFKVMRSAVFRQEVVRNMAFAAIGNMGSMTTPPNLLRPVTSTNLAGVGTDGRFLASSRQVFVDASTSCFQVAPRDGSHSIGTKLPAFFQDSVPEVKFTTYAVVQRLADKGCGN